MIREGASKYSHGGSGSWSRFFARILDMNLHFLTVIVILYFFMGFTNVSNGTENGSSSGYSDNFILDNFIYVPIALLFESFLMATWGTTLGKKLFGIVVKRSDGGNLSYLDAMSRNFKIWFFGMALTFPGFVLIPLVMNFRKNNKNIKTSWDLDFEVYQKEISKFRLSFSMLIVITLVVGIYVIYKYS